MWVKCVKNGLIRFVTRPVNTKYFEDDGEFSGKHPSPVCWWKHYEPLYKYDEEKFTFIQSNKQEIL